ncbi:MAG: CD1871A family CXXC motif-containing protein [Bacillota bacterium]
MNKIISWSVLILSALSLAYGFSRGEHDEILLKAVNICLECIGIG